MTENLAARGEMTLEQFLEKLEQTPRDWKRDGHGRIRNSGKQCPVRCIRDVLKAGVTRIMDDDLVKEIVYAADDGGEPNCRPELRAKLLKACGL